jgi:predicted site-specific integrase-resolvase
MKTDPKNDGAISQINFLTLREAAEVLRLSTRTVREYVSRGEIQPTAGQFRNW